MYQSIDVVNKKMIICENTCAEYLNNTEEKIIHCEETNKKIKILEDKYDNNVAHVNELNLKIENLEYNNIILANRLDIMNENYDIATKELKLASKEKNKMQDKINELTKKIFESGVTKDKEIFEIPPIHVYQDIIDGNMQFIVNFMINNQVKTEYAIRYPDIDTDKIFGFSWSNALDSNSFIMTFRKRYHSGPGELLGNYYSDDTEYFKLHVRMFNVLAKMREKINKKRDKIHARYSFMIRKFTNGNINHITNLFKDADKN